MRRNDIVGACLSQFHDDENSFELLLGYADGREIGHVLSKRAAQEIAAVFANEFPAALSIEQTQPVKVKALEWREFCSRSGNSEAKTSFGEYVIQSERDGWMLYLLNEQDARTAYSTIDFAKSAAQQDYETRIRSAIVGVAGTSIPADLVERCSEIFGWKESGILTGDKLRGQARAIRENFNCVFDAGEALRQAEEETKREAMRFIIALSTTRIADSAEAGGSATLSKGISE